jgi:A/G-specific adenine glycosylase
MRRFGGRVPRDPASLLALPGVGKYTAGAISSIAYGRAEPILDGNVRRVLARVFALDAGRVGPRNEEKILWHIAGTLVRGTDPGALNQALMELGALVCIPREPDCDACPLRASCAAVAEGDPEAFPTRRASRPTVDVDVAVAWIRRAGRVLIARPPDAGPLCGTWDLPAYELPAGSAAEPVIVAGLKRDRGIGVTVGAPLTRLSHGITHRRLRLRVYDCRHENGRVAGRDDLRWLDPHDLDGVAISGATRKIAKALERAVALRRATRTAARSRA